MVNLGQEFSGAVIDLGEGVTSVSVGDNVVVWPIYYCGKCVACQRGRYNACRLVGFHGANSNGGGIRFPSTAELRYRFGMEHLGTFNAFVHAADTGSFVAAGRNTGLSASAVGKPTYIRRDRSRRDPDRGRPSERLRVSMPLVGMLLTPVIAEFMAAYSSILLDLDHSDRIVDVVEEGFDVVIRTGAATDSRLMRRSLGRFSGRMVASPQYPKVRGHPDRPEELASHACLRQRSPATGKLADWPLLVANSVHLILPETMSATTIEPLIYLAEKGFGIAFLPPSLSTSRPLPVRWCPSWKITS